MIHELIHQLSRMIFTHFTDSKNINSIRKKGVMTHENYRGYGILLYPELKMGFKSHSPDNDLKNAEEIVNKLESDRKWEVIGAAHLRQEKKSIVGVKIHSSESFWPMKVFIDLHNEIAYKLGEILNENESDDIQYLGTQSLANTIANIKHEKFVLESEFLISSEEGLHELVDCFSMAGGGIWSAHSFDCMIRTDIEPDEIIEFIEYP